jgi:hypothetical protein
MPAADVMASVSSYNFAAVSLSIGCSFPAACSAAKRVPGSIVSC